MTVLEFESWVSDNYEELVALSKQQCKSMQSTYNGEISADVLHALVEDVLNKPALINRLDPSRLMGWFNRSLWRDGSNAKRDAASDRRQAHEMNREITTLGQDAYGDARRISQKRRDFNKQARKITQSRVNPMQGVEWSGPMPGNIRWRFQTLRDNKSFDMKAVESLRDSIRKAAARYRHFGEHGYSFTEFGGEFAHVRSTAEVAR